MSDVPRVFLLPLRAVQRPWVLQVLASGARVTLMEKSLQQVVASRVEKAIADLGFRSREDFANEAGLSRATLNRLLSGKYDVRLSTIELVSKALSIPASELLQASPDGLLAIEPGPRQVGAKKKSGIVVKILVPKDEAIPFWLVEACREGAGLIEQEPTKRKPRTTGTSPRRSVGLKEILHPRQAGKSAHKGR